MTTEGEQQEAVCGTCGDRAGHAYHDTDCGCSGTLIGPSVNGYTGPHHEFIQAPVVPSDDERCAFPNSQWGVCGIPESAHADLMEPLAGSRFHHEYQIPAPPTPSQDAEGDGPVCSCGEPAASHCDDEIHARELRLGRECPFTHHPFDDVRRRAYASYDTWEGKGLSRDARESGFIYGYERGRADAVSAIREPYEALVEARGWSARVEYDGQFALVIEWPGEPPYGRYWWVLCPAAATLHDDPPSEDEDPTKHDHGACSLSPECDFNELHALAHQAIRDRAAALESLGGRST